MLLKDTFLSRVGLGIWSILRFIKKHKWIILILITIILMNIFGIYEILYEN